MVCLKLALLTVAGLGLNAAFMFNIPSLAAVAGLVFAMAIDMGSS